MFAVMFLQSGYSKAKAFQSTEKMMSHFGFPVPRLSLIGAIAMEIGGGALLLFGIETRVVAGSLIVFIVMASVMIPCKAIFIPDKRKEAWRAIFTNVALVGGLLPLLAASPIVIR